MKNKILIAVAALVLAYAGWQVSRSGVFEGEVAAEGFPVLNVETGHRFYIEITRDFEGWPTKAPDTGKQTGYPAEICFWNECGQIEGGTWVALQDEDSKPCPVCGRTVRPRNPRPPGFQASAPGGPRDRAEPPAEAKPESKRRRGRRRSGS